MDFFIKEGYADAAKAFAEESGVTMPREDEAFNLEQRSKLRQSIQNGQIDEALDMISDIDCVLLDDPKLRFRLHQQQFIELIRADKIEDALEYAQTYLAPLGRDDSTLLQELERTVTLLIFEKKDTGPLGDLLDLSQRLCVAECVNSTLLDKHTGIQEPRLVTLLKMMMWAQDQLKEKGYPSINDLATSQLE